MDSRPHSLSCTGTITVGQSWTRTRKTTMSLKVDKHHVNETVYRDVVVGEIKMQNIVSIFLQK